MTFDLNIFRGWFSLTLARSSSKVKVIGQSSVSREENVAKVVGATSSEDFQFYGRCVLWT